MRRIAFLSLLVSAVSVLGCGGSSGPADDTSVRRLSGNEYIVLSQDSLALTDEGVSGLGVIAFREPLGAVSSDSNFVLSFSIEDGGFVELRSYGKDDLSGDVGVKLARSDKLLSLTVLAASGETAPRALAGVQADAQMSLSIEVHNTETPAHVLAWSPSEAAPNDDNSLFNSDADAVAPGNGAGHFWGLALASATVSAASVGPARFAH